MNSSSPRTVSLRELAERRRRILIRAMGGKCQQCGHVPEIITKLEFHHVQPRSWIASSVSRWSRQAKYEKDFESGVLELLCRSCNAKAGSPAWTDDVPF